MSDWMFLKFVYCISLRESGIQCVRVSGVGRGHTSINIKIFGTVGPNSKFFNLLFFLFSVRTYCLAIQKWQWRETNQNINFFCLANAKIQSSVFIYALFSKICVCVSVIALVEVMTRINKFGSCERVSESRFLSSRFWRIQNASSFCKSFSYKWMYSASFEICSGSF